MTETIHIRASEQGVVRVFAVDLPADGIAAFTRRNGSWPLREALGAQHLDAGRIDVFDVADLDGVGLTGYLQEGAGIPADQIAPLRARLDGLSGTVLVVPTSAFGGTEQTLTPRAPLRLVATLTESRDPVTFRPLPDQSARATEPEPPAAPARKAPSDAAMSGRVAMIALVVLGLLVGLMVWIAA